MHKNSSTGIVLRLQGYKGVLDVFRFGLHTKLLGFEWLPDADSWKYGNILSLIVLLDER